MSKSSIDYRIDVHDPQAHLFRVTLRVPAPAAPQRVSLPVWIPEATWCGSSGAT